MERVAVTGAGGLLGRLCVAVLESRGHMLLGFRHETFDISSSNDRSRLAAWNPTVVVNCAAWTDVDGCARNPALALRINGTAAGALAEAAVQAGARCVQISTNEVFSGSKQAPYLPEDEPSPINPYGASKLEGERLVAAAGQGNLIVRTAWLFGPRRPSFVTKILTAAARAAERGEALRVVDDEWGNPTWAPALAERIADAIEAERHGVVHLAGWPAVSRHGWASRILDAAGYSIEVEPILSAEFVRASRPPLRSVLAVMADDALRLEWTDPCDHYVHGVTARTAAQ